MISSCYSYTWQLARSGSYSRAGYNNNNIGSQSDRITPPFFKNSSDFMLEKVEMNTTDLE